MTLSPTIKVGIIVFLAIIAFGSVYLFLNRYSLDRNTYEITAIFDDVKGMSKDSSVTMAGVQVGIVKEITLNENQQAVVVITINNKYKIPIGSHFILRVGLLVGDKMLDIVPNRGAKTYLSNGDKVKGEIPASLDDLVPAAKKLLQNLTDVTNNINKVFGDKAIQEHFKNSLANIDLATTSLAESMAALSAEKENFHAIVGNFSSASTNLLDLSRRMDDFVKHGGAQENIAGTLAAARKSAESLERITESLESIATDPQTKNDLKQTIHEGRLAVERAREILDSIGGVFGDKKGPGGERSTLPTRRTSLDTIIDSDVRFDVSTTIPLRDNKFVKLGVRDIGDTNGLIVQAGRPLDKNTDFRYGLYASRLGLGVDHSFSPKTFGTMNLYDHNELKLDVQAGYNLSDNWGVLLGIDRAFRDNQLAVGVRYTK